MQQQIREFLEEFCVSPQDFVGDYIPISPGISHPAPLPGLDTSIDRFLGIQTKLHLFYFCI